MDRESEGKASKSEQKECKYRKKLEIIRSKRKEKKEDKKRKRSEFAEHELSDNEDRKTKKQIKEMVKERCLQGMRDGQKICIDLSFNDKDMSKKELSRLAQQLGRLYGSNKKYDTPAHLYFTGLNKNGLLYLECVRKHEGFENYLVEMKEGGFLDTFTCQSVVYLSPDSENVLATVDPEKVYVIGGLVDEFIRKNITTHKASENNLTTARLPIKEYMMKSRTESFCKPLAINQVFDILMTYRKTNDWRTALQAGIPARFGYVVKPVDIV